MKEKEREKNETEKKGVKKVPMRESNPRPLNLHASILSQRMHAHS